MLGHVLQHQHLRPSLSNKVIRVELTIRGDQSLLLNLLVPVLSSPHLPQRSMLKNVLDPNLLGRVISIVLHLPKVHVQMVIVAAIHMSSLQPLLNPQLIKTRLSCRLLKFLANSTLKAHVIKVRTADSRTCLPRLELHCCHLPLWFRVFLCQNLVTFCPRSLIAGFCVIRERRCLHALRLVITTSQTNVSAFRKVSPFGKS